MVEEGTAGACLPEVRDGDDLRGGALHADQGGPSEIKLFDLGTK